MDGSVGFYLVAVLLLPTRLPLAHISEPLAGGKHQSSAVDPGRIRSGCDPGAKRDLGMSWVKDRRKKKKARYEGVPINMLAMLVRDLGFLLKCNPAAGKQKDYKYFNSDLCQNAMRGGACTAMCRGLDLAPFSGGRVCVAARPYNRWSAE